MRRSVFIRYALSYTLVLLLLFSGVTLYMVHSAQRQVQEDIITSQVNRLTRIAIRHEDYISTMLSTAEEIGLSPHIEPFRFEEEPWKAYDLQLQLVPYTATNSFCEQLYLYFPEDDRLYSSSASMTLDRFTRMTHFAETSADEMSALLRTADRLTVLPAQRVTSGLIDGTDSRMVTFILPLGASPAGSKGAVLFLIKESVYRDLFADAIDTDLNTYILTGDRVLAAAEDLPLSSEDLETAPDGEYSHVFTHGGERWLSVALAGRSWGMRYETVLRMADVSTAIRSSLSRLLLFLFALLVVSILLILWVARRHAKPIEAISGLLAPGDDTVRRDELTRISTGIRHLTRTNSELSSRLDEALPMQRHDFVLRFFKGRFSSSEDTAAAADKVGLDIRKPYYAAILCSPSADRDRPFEMMREPFSSLADVTAAGVELVAMKAILYLAFAEDPDALHTLAEMIRRESGNDETACVTAISAVHSHMEEAPAAYLEAAAAYDNRFVMGHSRVLAYTDISSSLEGILPRAQKITNSISQALALSNRELLDSRISELLHFLKNTNMSPFAFRMIYNNVIDTLTRDQAAKLAGHDARDFYDIFSLTSCQSIDDLDELLRRLCDRLLSGENTAEEEEPPAGDEIDQAIRYIDSHFTDPEISMTAIAESIDLSTTRLSLSFKERMGMTPSDYLTLLRCERARDLLENTDQTIREISTLVGYYDAGSFIRRFKQVTGETPLQYRRTRLPGKENTHEEE